MTTLFWIVAFCLGWRMVTDEGQLLFFLRKPFLGLLDEIENKNTLYKSFRPNLEQRIEFFKLKLKYYFGKPIVSCITCMASVWGILVFVTLNGFNRDLITPMILSCVSASFIQTFIWDLYVRHIK